MLKESYNMITKLHTFKNRFNVFNFFINCTFICTYSRDIRCGTHWQQGAVMDIPWCIQPVRIQVITTMGIISYSSKLNWIVVQCTILDFLNLC